MSARSPTMIPNPGPGRAIPRTRSQRLARSSAIVAAGLIHATLGVTVSVSGLVMPSGAVTVLGLVWIGGVAAMILGRNRTVLVLSIPVASWALWWAVLLIGETLFDWTA